MRSGRDRWRSRTTPMRRHPTRRAWIAIVLCLATFVLVLAVAITIVWVRQLP